MKRKVNVVHEFITHVYMVDFKTFMKFKLLQHKVEQLMHLHISNRNRHETIIVSLEIYV